MDFSRSNSFISDSGGLALGDDFFCDDDGGDLNRIFDDDDDDGDDQPEPLGKSGSRFFAKSENKSKDNSSKNDDNDDNNNNANEGDKNDADKERYDEDVENKEENNHEDEGGVKPKKKKRWRSRVAPAEVDIPDLPPAWHSQTADKPLREEMTREIAQLLQARKKTAPTKEWLQQLPHKARVLEDRLYRKAPCLEAYLNRATLKNRLRTLAVTITAHYKTTAKARKQPKHSSARSVRSMVSNDASHRGSISSYMGLPSEGPEGSLGAQLLAAACRGGSQEGYGPDSAPMNMDDGKGVPTEVAMSELARQKAVNEELQQQILANIRQQQQLVQSMRRGSNEIPVHNSNPMTSGDRQGNLIDASTSIMSGQFNNIRNTHRMQVGMSGNSMSGNHFLDGRGNNMSDHCSSLSASISNTGFEAQTILMRHASTDVGQEVEGNLNIGQVALMPQQSASGSVGMNMQGLGMQGAILRRASSTGMPNEAQFHPQQAAMMRPSSSSQLQNQVSQSQMQAALMRQAPGGGNQLNAAQAALMRQASAGGRPMTPDLHAALMRQVSVGGNQMNGQLGGPHATPIGNPILSNANMMGLQMGSNGINSGVVPTNGQIMPGFVGNQQMVMQANVMMHSMNSGGIQGMAQYAGLQQQIGLPMQRSSPMNDGSAPENMNFQSNICGDNLGLSQNSFGW